MQFDDLYKKLINGYVVEEGLFAAAGGIAKGAVKAVAKDIAPTATAAVEFIGDQFKRGPNGKLKLEKPISVSKDMEPAQVNALLDKVATLENEVEEDLGFPIVYKNETFYYLSHDDQNLTVTAANGQTRRIPLEGLELDIVPMDQVEDNETAKKVGMGALKLAGKAALGTAKLAGKSALEVANFATDGQLKKGIKFVKGSYQEDAESSPGRVKRSGASCKGSVTKLRKMAKKYGGEKGKMYHWCANMKGGRKKSEGEEDAEKKVSKTRAKCQAKAKRKYDVWPSAYASGYVQKCVNRGGKIK